MLFHATLALLAAVPTAEAVDFVREIQPVLERSCVQCHGPEKQKGKLRLDTREALFKGGEDGATLVEGKPDESDFLRRISLAEAHDDVMPPRGKAEHLSAAEIDLMRRWIAEGAPWPKGIVALAKPGGDAGAAGPAASPAELAARAELLKFGVLVRPLAAGVNWVRASLRGLQGTLPPAAWGHLGRLTNLVELDLGGVAIGDEQTASLAGLAHLAVLNLSQTQITDDGVARLAPLQQLTTLNLYGTGITDAGLAKLTSLKKLQHLYVAATGVTAEGIASLKAASPALHVDDGSDFTELAKPNPAPPK